MGLPEENQHAIVIGIQMTNGKLKEYWSTETFYEGWTDHRIWSGFETYNAFNKDYDGPALPWDGDCHSNVANEVKSGY